MRDWLRHCWVPLLSGVIFAVSLFFFLCAFLQPHYEGTITSMGRIEHHERSSGRGRHRSQYYTVPVTVFYTDGAGNPGTASVRYAFDVIQDAPKVGDRFWFGQGVRGTLRWPDRKQPLLPRCRVKRCRTKPIRP